MPTSNTLLSPYRLMIIKVFLSACFWGATFIAGKMAAPFITPSILSFMRLSVASTFLFIVISKRGGLPKLNKQQIIGVAVLGLTGSVMYNIFMQIGLDTVSATRASLISATTPLYVTLGAIIFFKEKLSKLQLFGVLITSFGASLIITNGNYSIGSALTMGDLAVFGGMLSWAVYTLAGKIVLKTIEPLAATTWSAIFALIMLVPFAGYELYMYEVSFPIEVWCAALYLGVFGTGLAFVWFSDAIKVIGAARASVFLNFEPLSAVVLASMLLNESITIIMAIGGALCLFGIYLTNQNPINAKHKELAKQ